MALSSPGVSALDQLGLGKTDNAVLGHLPGAVAGCTGAQARDFDIGKVAEDRWFARRAEMNLSISPGMAPSSVRGVTKLTTNCFLGFALTSLAGELGLAFASERSDHRGLGRIGGNGPELSGPVQSCLLKGLDCLDPLLEQLLLGVELPLVLVLEPGKAAASARRLRYLVSTSASAPLRNKETPPIRAP